MVVSDFFSRYCRSISYLFLTCTSLESDIGFFCVNLQSSWLVWTGFPSLLFKKLKSSSDIKRKSCSIGFSVDFRGDVNCPLSLRGSILLSQSSLFSVLYAHGGSFLLYPQDAGGPVVFEHDGWSSGRQSGTNSTWSALHCSQTLVVVIFAFSGLFFLVVIVFGTRDRCLRFNGKFAIE